MCPSESADPLPRGPAAAPVSAAADPVAAALISRLAAEGAAEHGHRGQATLLDHLVGTYEIVRRWHQPVALQHAALLHSVYGTDAYAPRLLAPGRRAELRAIAGADAERLAYLFSVTPRGPLLAGTHLWARDLPRRDPGDDAAGDEPPADRTELDALVVLHMANLAEQARAPDGSPVRWLVRLHALAERLIRDDALARPAFLPALDTVSEADEALAIRAYQDGVRGDAPAGAAPAGDAPSAGAARADRLALAAAVCPVIGEPCVWLAYLALARADAGTARDWARHAQHRLRALGAAWDKRLTFDQWLTLAQRLENAGDAPLPVGARAVTDPRALADIILDGDAPGRPRGPASAERSRPAPGPAGGRQRFQRYVETLAAADGPAGLGVYPELESRPWLSPAQFPLVRYLESHAEAIRAEIIGLKSRFQRESERIGRAGEWDVLFFYERGRRHDDVCAACPVTTRGIESHATMRTAAGLIYASRLRAGTHIHPHRGPTNLRVRCHLGLVVPEGDCAIRVGEEARRWTPGRCVVFDDYFEHEAWNHTEQDRIVLIVDLWHPGLSAEEVRLLEGLHGYTHRYARQLNRYWSANARAAAERPSGLS